MAKPKELTKKPQEDQVEFERVKVGHYRSLDGHFDVKKLEGQWNVFDNASDGDRMWLSTFRTLKDAKKAISWSVCPEKSGYIWLLR